MNNNLSPQDFVEKAKLAYQTGDYSLAAQIFSEATTVYTEMGDALMAAEMRNNQSVSLLRAKNPQAALEAVQGTDKVFAEAGEGRRQGMALANRASALQALKRVPDAIDDFKKAGDVLQKADEGDLRVEVMQLLSMLYLRKFKIYEAILALQSGLAGAKNPTPRQRFMKKILFMRL
jgi:tetratricopeptide (TPR) repeat protein